MQNNLRLILCAIHANVDFSHKEVWSHDHISDGDQFATAINIIAFFGEYHAEKAADEFAYLFLTYGCHEYVVIGDW